MKKTLSILLALILTFSFAFSLDAFAEDDGVIIEFVVDTLRAGSKPTYEINASFSEYYTAKIDGWYDSSENPIDGNYTYTLNENITLEFTVTFADPEIIEEEYEIGCYVNGKEAEEISKGENTIKYKVVLRVMDQYELDLIGLVVDAQNGFNAAEPGVVVKISSEHMDFSNTVKQNGIEVTNLSHYSDKSGIIVYPDKYRLVFSVKPDDGYYFSDYGEVSLRGNGAYELNVNYKWDENENAAVIAVEVLTNSCPTEISDIDFVVRPASYGVDKSYFEVLNENITLKTVSVRTKKGGIIKMLIPGEYVINFVAETKNGFAYSEICDITVDGGELEVKSANETSFEGTITFKVTVLDGVKWFFGRIYKAFTRMF